MKSAIKEVGIYIDGKLADVGYDDYAMSCNLQNCIRKYGEDRVSLKILNKITDDKEIQEFWETLKKYYQETGKAKFHLLNDFEIR